MNYKVVVDSTFYLPEEDFTKHGIKRASLNVIEREDTFKELDLDNEFIYRKLAEGHRLTTSQPSPAEFLHLYQECIKEGADTIFVLTLAEPLSGTYQSAMIAQKMLDEPEKVHLFKSRMAAFGNEMLTQELVKMIDAKKTKEEIISRIDNLISRSYLDFTIENLIHLMRSGRLSRAKAMIGTVLRVKPIITMCEGRLDMENSARTHKKVIDSIIEHMIETTKDAKKIIIRVASKNSLDSAKALEEKIRETFKNIELSFTEYIGPIFSLHLGTNAYGVSWCSE